MHRRKYPVTQYNVNALRFHFFPRKNIVPFFEISIIVLLVIISGKRVDVIVYLRMVCHRSIPRHTSSLFFFVYWNFTTCVMIIILLCIQQYNNIEINLKLIRKVSLLSSLSTRITQRQPTCISEQHTSFLSYKMLKPLSST